MGSQPAVVVARASGTAASTPAAEHAPQTGGARLGWQRDRLDHPAASTARSRCSAVFSFNDSIVFSLPWAGFTTKWYHEALGDANLRAALRNSFLVAGIVAPVSVVLGTLAAFCDHPPALPAARPGRPCCWRRRSSCPGWSIGVSALIFFSKLNVGAVVATRVVPMQIVVTFPLVTVLVVGRLARFDRTQEEAAVDLGASQLQVSATRSPAAPHAGAGRVVRSSPSRGRSTTSRSALRGWLRPALPRLGLLDPAPRVQPADRQRDRHAGLRDRGRSLVYFA